MSVFQQDNCPDRENGAGKTTINDYGLPRPTSDRYCAGKPGAYSQFYRVSARIPAFRTLLSEQLFESLAGIRGLRYREVENFLEKAKDLFELQAHWKKTLRSCSKGTRQKVGIIQAFMHNPQLVVMDEPTTGLDPAVRYSFFQFLRQKQSQGVSIIISSHNLKEIENQADYYLFFHQNRILKAAHADELGGNYGVYILADQEIPSSLLPELAKLSATADDNRIVVTKRNLINDVLSILIQSGIEIKNILPEGSNLEDYFLNLVDES